jgi:lipopolysaccharide export system permease protein
MLNVNELNYTLDSLHKSYNKDLISFAENINQRTRVTNYNLNVTNPIVKIKTEVKPNTDLVSLFTLTEKGQLLDVASSNISNALFSINSSNDEMKFKRKNINNHWLALYDKFVVAYACMLMFFIGAPLGAIIRKGGIGLPIVFAVLIFITFHFINTFGKRMSQEDGLNPFWGAWMASIVLTPLAISLTYRATNDIGLINLDILLKPFRKLFQKFFPTEK